MGGQGKMRGFYLVGYLIGGLSDVLNHFEAADQQTTCGMLFAFDIQNHNLHTISQVDFIIFYCDGEKDILDLFFCCDKGTCRTTGNRSDYLLKTRPIRYLS